MSVSDNGIGIAEMSQDKVFDEFFRKSNNSVVYDIELHIVKQTVEVLEGSVKVKSAWGRGSCFV
ncbi:sensor histidine kinase [Flavobacterium salmonis]|uniref:sensor histidine kinase n=1 Tax=Flavobacterium salmonis TaxID=2654844 RepID=UPI0036119466